MSRSRLAAGWVVGTVGILVVLLAVLAMRANYDDFLEFSCGGAYPYPVCGSVWELIAVIIVVALAGAAMVVVGILLATRPRKNRQSALCFSILGVLIKQVR